MIDVAPEIAGTIQIPRQNGVGCQLASNPELCKARDMSEVLGSCDLFEREFYSCRMGVMKPDRAYFRAIVSGIEVPPNQIRFVHDLAVNVDSAREVGRHAVPFDLETGRDQLKRILGESGRHVTEQASRTGDSAGCFPVRQVFPCRLPFTAGMRSWERH